jgi:hypothetical protein
MSAPTTTKDQTEVGKRLRHEVVSPRGIAMLFPHPESPAHPEDGKADKNHAKNRRHERAQEEEPRARLAGPP